MHLLLAGLRRELRVRFPASAFLFFELLKIVGPLRLMPRHQQVMAACVNRGEVLSAGHAALYHHGGLGFVSMRCSVTPSISSIVVMSGRLPAKTSDPWESLPRRAPDRKALVCNQGANRASSHAASWGRPGTSPRSSRGQIVKQNVFFKRKETLFPPTERRFNRPHCPA